MHTQMHKYHLYLHQHCHLHTLGDSDTEGRGPVFRNTIIKRVAFLILPLSTSLYVCLQPSSTQERQAHIKSISFSLDRVLVWLTDSFIISRNSLVIQAEVLESNFQSPRSSILDVGTQQTYLVNIG